jgi:hypothetical protein
MRPGIVILVGVILLLAGLVPTFDATLPVWSGTLGPPSQMTYTVPGSVGSVPVSVTWETVTGAPFVEVTYCPPGSSPLGATCAQLERLNGMYSGGTDFGSVPAGSLVVVTVVGPAGTSAHVSLQVGSAQIGLALFATGFAVMGLGLWMRRRLVAHRPPASDVPELQLD